MERDEVYVSTMRSELGMPPPGERIIHEDYFGNTPLYTLFNHIVQQMLGFFAYLAYNVSGQRRYSKWTNHFNPNSIFFNKTQRTAVLVSDLVMLGMITVSRWVCATWGRATVVKYYGVPWLFRLALVCHDSSVFLHDVAHFHVVHHIFPKMPWYHGEAATVYLCIFIGRHYHRSSKPVFPVLWDNYNKSQFVDDEGDIVFHRNKREDAPFIPAFDERNN